MIYVYNAITLFEGGTQLDFFRNGSISIPTSSSNGSKDYSLSLRCRLKSLKSCFNWKVLNLHGLGKKERPLERRLFSSSKRGICDQFTTVFKLWTLWFSDGDGNLVLQRILLCFLILSSRLTFLHFLSLSCRKILSIHCLITVKLSTKFVRPLNLNSFAVFYYWWWAMSSCSNV